jgi:hypothetical protein
VLLDDVGRSMSDPIDKVSLVALVLEICVLICHDWMVSRGLKQIQLVPPHTQREKRGGPGVEAVNQFRPYNWLLAVSASNKRL